ncbi:MAG: LuxR C-terminal-related transcriptional regulator [Clostridiales Family XIII bacterium]|jgi:LuxR family maltose regulon positive regulatory protein|nr:LuxR C-terminal-related transcriptional regulator [Clostridiales Family XIII bacterium]
MRTRIYHNERIFLPEKGVYLERPRVKKLLENAVKSPYVAVIAGSGYGKTQAVYSFLREYDAPAAWIQLSERDNSPMRFWESFSRTMELYNKRLAARMLELGFPETDDRFAEVAAIPEDELAPNEKHILVFDDFHLIEDGPVLNFMKRAAHVPFPNITMILISRTNPDINLVSLLSKGLLVHINEDELRFTEDETALYFRLLDIPLSSQNVSDIYNDTEGWAFALNLAGLSLKKSVSRQHGARIAMKLNVFSMIENEVFLSISEELRRFLIKLSLIDRLSTDLISGLAKDETLVSEMGRISAFVRYDIYLNAYHIHHLFLDYLRQKQDVLTEEEKRDVYLDAARWCEKNDYKADAVTYYHKAGEYAAIIRIACGFPMQIPFEQVRFLLSVYAGGPADLLEQIPAYHYQHSRLLISIGRYDEASAELKNRISKYSALPDSDFNRQILCGAYVELGIIGYLTLPDTDRCDFDVLMKKAEEYYRPGVGAEYLTSTGISLNAWASKVGSARKGAMEEYIETLTLAIPHVSRILDGCMSGLDDLAQGELQFYKGNLKQAAEFSERALRKAEAHRQYEVHNRSLFYLIRIAVARGDFEKIRELFKILEFQSENDDYALRFTSYDIVCGWYYALLGQPRLVPVRFKGEFSHESIGTFIAGFGNFVKTKFYYADKRYYELLSFIDSGRGTDSILFGKLEMKVLEAACYSKIKDAEAALSSLKEAYDLSASNDLIMPFIGLGKDMRTLTAAAMRDKRCDIPLAWLQMINRKAATYAKRLTGVVSEYKKMNNISDDVRLSARETDVLNDLYHGLSRSEIAAGHNLSINTVKMVLNTIYAKLNADNIADVIRTALEQKLIP